MSPEIFLLVVGSAVLHATWNLALRSVKGHLGVAYFGALLGGTACSVGAIATVDFDAPRGDILRPVVGAVASGLIHALYFMLLAHAYRQAAHRPSPCILTPRQARPAF